MTRFSSLASSFLGFDSLFTQIDRLLDIAANSSAGSGFPPYNLYREADGYSIEMAVAGYKREDLKIELDRATRALAISGVTNRSSLNDVPPALENRATTSLDGVGEGQTSVPPAERTRKQILQGIATRKFCRTFTITDDIDVVSASLIDGMLTVRLRQLDRSKSEVELIEISQGSDNAATVL